MDTVIIKKIHHEIEKYKLISKQSG